MTRKINSKKKDTEKPKPVSTKLKSERSLAHSELRVTQHCFCSLLINIQAIEFYLWDYETQFTLLLAQRTSVTSIFGLFAGILISAAGVTVHDVCPKNIS